MRTIPLIAVGLASITVLGFAVAPADAGVAPRSQRAATSWKSQGVTGIRGVDVSLWDHVGSVPLDFNVLHDQGVRFVFIKASDMNARADQQAAGWWAVDKPAAEASRMLVGGYQYAYPTSKVSRIVANARSAAKRMAARVGVLQPGQLPVVLDLESAPRKLGPTRLTRWAVTWLKTAEELTGRRPILYTYTYFAQNRLRAIPELTRYPLWQAEFRPGSTRPARLRGWPAATPAIWQFSSRGQLRGRGAPRTDLNVFLGDPAQLLALAGLGPSAADYYDLPGTPTRKPTPTPTLTPTPTPTPTPTLTPTPTPTLTVSPSPTTSST